jgi:DNA-binding LacI/PurR family transcriptional regulator/DNA-binding transcriptional regulator YhcF (GntR family)
LSYAKTRNTNIAVAAPVYRQIEDDMRQRIRSGQWPEGAMIPGRLRLCDDYGVHLRTLERAIKALLNDGTLMTRGTKGTFVAAAAVLTTQIEEPGQTPRGNRIGKPSSTSSSQPLVDRKSPGLLGIASTSAEVSDWDRFIIQSIERSFAQAGGATVYHQGKQSGERPSSLSETVRELVALGCDGIAVVSIQSPSPPVSEIEAALPYAAFPLVFVCSSHFGVPVSNVYYDNFDAGFQAARHLLTRGCRYIDFLAHTHIQWADERVAGVKEAIRREGLPANTLRLHFPAQDVEALKASAVPLAIANNPYGECRPHDTLFWVAGYELTQGMLQAGTKLDGMIAANDYIALGAIIAASESRLQPGRDFLIIGFDDLPEARTANLTSSRPPLEELGSVCAGLMTDTLLGAKPGRRICLPSELVTRLSTSARHG